MKRSGEAGTPFLGLGAEPNFGSERQQLVRLGVRLIDEHPNEHPRRTGGPSEVARDSGLGSLQATNEHGRVDCSYVIELSIEQVPVE